jgi:hypothetical protein
MTLKCKNCGREIRRWKSEWWHIVIADTTGSGTLRNRRKKHVFKNYIDSNNEDCMTPEPIPLQAEASSILGSPKSDILPTLKGGASKGED